MTFEAEIPKGPPDEVGEVHDLLQVDRETRGLRYVVAYLAAPTNSPSLRAAAAPVTGEPPQIVDQINHQFVPRVVATRAGKPVIFASRDTANHNVRASSSSRSNEFNVFTGMGARYEHQFPAVTADQPVQLDCDIHPWMRGWIYVFDHPWFAVTDDKGRFSIGPVPPGDYTLVLQQPDIRYKRQTNITVSASSPTSVEIAIRARSGFKPLHFNERKDTYDSISTGFAKQNESSRIRDSNGSRIGSPRPVAADGPCGAGR